MVRQVRHFTRAVEVNKEYDLLMRRRPLNGFCAFLDAGNGAAVAADVSILLRRSSRFV